MVYKIIWFRTFFYLIYYATYYSTLNVICYNPILFYRTCILFYRALILSYRALILSGWLFNVNIFFVYHIVLQYPQRYFFYNPIISYRVSIIGLYIVLLCLNPIILCVNLTLLCVNPILLCVNPTCIRFIV